MSLVANPIVETVRAPYSNWYYDYRLDNIVGNDGKVYTPFAWYEFPPGSSEGKYYVGVAYSGDQVFDLASMGIKPFRGEEIKRRSATGSPVEDTVSTVDLYSAGYESDYNSVLKIGYRQIISFEKFTLSLPAKDEYLYKWWIPYLGDKYADPEEFWNKLKNLPKPKLAFEVDTSVEGGGDGEYDDNSSDTIGLPDLTALNQNSISNTKFLTCYKMTPAQLSKLGDELWSENIFTQISNTVLKPTDFIVNLSLLPVDVSGVTKLIKAGKILLNGAEGTLISQQFIRVDCGTLEVKKKWGGAIDYQTDVSIFFPFIGEQSLNANEVMGASLNIIYTVDILSGSCIASVRVIKDGLDAVLYQFTGNMASNYPITSADYATVFSGALQLAVGVGSLPSSGGVLSLLSATSNMLSGADVKRTGSLSSASGFMGIKKPYLILSRPIQSLPSEYNTFRGYVSNITLALSGCSGFTKVAEIHLENIPATSAELDELDGLLKAGVIF